MTTRGGRVKFTYLARLEARGRRTNNILAGACGALALACATVGVVWYVPPLWFVMGAVALWGALTFRRRAKFHAELEASYRREVA